MAEYKSEYKSREWRPYRTRKKDLEKFFESVGGTAKGKPHSTREGRISAGKRLIKRKTEAATDRDRSRKNQQIRVLKSPSGVKNPIEIKVRKRPGRGALGEALRGGGRAFNRGGKV